MAAFVPTLRAVALFCICAISGHLGLMLRPEGGFATLVWPPTGIALAALFRWGLGLWPAVAAASFVVDLGQGAAVPAALGTAAGVTLETVVAAAVLRRASPGAHPLGRIRFVVWLVTFAAFAATALAATVGVASLRLGGVVPARQEHAVWLAWWLGDAASVLIQAPLLLAWMGARLELPRSRRRRYELVSLVVLTTIVAVAVFVHGRVPMLRPYLVIFPLIWAALRFGPRGGATLTFLVTAFAVSSAIHGAPVFGEASLAANLLALQTYMIVAAGTVLLVAAATMERTRAEVALRDGEQRLRLAQQAARIGVFETDLRTGETRWTPETEAMHGLPPGGFDARGRRWLDLVHPEERQLMEEHVRHSLETGAPCEGEWRVVWPDGNVHWLSGRWQVFTDDAGRPLRLVGACVDVTGRKQVENALRINSERLAVFADASFEGIIQLDDGHIVDSNEQFARMSGYTVAGMKGLAAVDVVPDEDRERVRSHLEANEPCNLEHGLLRKDNTRILVESRGRPIATGPGKRRMVVLRDITERKRYEEEARSAARRKDEFIAMLGHELRNPLAPIRNSLHVLGRAAPGAVEAQRAVAVIDRQVTHLTRLVEDLLEITRISRGKVELRRELVELNELARHASDDLRSVFDASGVRLELQRAEGEVWVDGDPVRLAQVLGNLLQNAAKFTPRGGLTTVTVARDAAHGQAVLTVTDTGRGLAPEAIPHIFDPFTQADTTLDRRMGGLGLGLALARGLVEQHGGTVSGWSRGVGLGATFVVRLPLQPDRRSAPRLPPAPSPAESLRILIIEDNRDAAESLRDVLALDGHEVALAEDGPTGIQRARQLRPQVVLCDIGLPGMDGYRVARAFRQDPVLRSVYLVALTGYAQPEDVARAREAGFDRHLAKPPTLDALESVLARPEA